MSNDIDVQAKEVQRIKLSFCGINYGYAVEGEPSANGYAGSYVLASDYEEVVAEMEALRGALQRINTDYRESSGLPLHLQAYCMRSEAKVALGLEDEQSWQREIERIKNDVLGVNYE